VEYLDNTIYRYNQIIYVRGNHLLQADLPLNVHCLRCAVRGEVVGADLGVHLVGAHDAEGHLWLGAPLDVVAGVDRPALGGAGGGEPRHVAAEVGEALAAALEHVGIQLARHRLRHVLGSGARCVRQVELALARVVDQELEALARGRDGDGGGAASWALVVFEHSSLSKISHLSARRAVEKTALSNMVNDTCST
jgi:hypothetical protein